MLGAAGAMRKTRKDAEQDRLGTWRVRAHLFDISMSFFTFLDLDEFPSQVFHFLA
jgi:hypothetical protein